MKVEFLDLKVQYEGIKDEINAAVEDVLRRGKFILGEEVLRLEEGIASFCGTKYAVGVASGTDALVLSLRASGIGEGHSVITTPFTFVATAEAILRVGAKVIFCDISSRTLNIDVGKLDGKITGDTKAILPVHLYGQAVEMAPLMEVAQKHNLIVIEDVAQAFGGEYKGKKLGSLGKAGCLSFFPTKILGACGDAGMVVTDDRELRDMIRLLRGHGCRQKHGCETRGYNSRLDEIQAAILRVKLKKVGAWITLRRKIAKLYSELLKGTGVVIPFEAEYGKHTYNYYCLRCSRRDALVDHLASKQIQTGIYYPVPLHLQDGFKFLQIDRGELPVAEKMAEEVLAIPIFPEMTESQIHYVADTIRSFYK